MSSSTLIECDAQEPIELALLPDLNLFHRTAPHRTGTAPRCPEPREYGYRPRPGLSVSGPSVPATTGAFGPFDIFAGVGAATEPVTVTADRLPALHQLLDEPHEFGGLEGLGEEGVDSDVEAALDLVLGTGADDGERKVPRAGVGAEAGGGAQSVEAGHHDIEGDDIGPNLVDDVQTFGTVSGGHDLETLQFEVDPDQLPDDLVVVHNKHPAGRAWHNSRVGPGEPPRPGFPHFHPVRARPRSANGRLSPARVDATRPTPQNRWRSPLKELVGFYPSPHKAPDTPP